MREVEENTLSIALQLLRAEKGELIDVDILFDVGKYFVFVLVGRMNATSVLVA